MQRTSFDIEFVTPAFVGGADPKRAELNANGIRGQLRWWLRALAGGRFGGDLARVSSVEDDLFGTTDQRSRVRIVVTGQPETSKSTLPCAELDSARLARDAGTGEVARLRIVKQGAEVATNAIGYLGFGPVRFNGDTDRQYFAAGSSGSFFVQHRDLPPVAASLFEDSLWAWMNLGGLGSRSRRGFGSLRCLGFKPSGNARPPIFALPLTEDRDSFQRACTELFGRNLVARAGLPEWTHVSSQAAVFCSASPFRDWVSAMTAAAAWLIAFRRRYGLGNGLDYDWLKAEPIPSGAIPHRAGFGLPLQFGQGVMVRSRLGRRASPLLLHIARFGADYHVVFTYLPGRFLPTTEQMSFRGTRARPAAAHVQIVADFLSELTTRGKLTRIT